MIARALELLRTAACHAHEGRCLGIALGIPGLIDARTGTLLFAPNLGWRDVPLHEILQESFPDTLIFVENEARLAAQGELIAGAAQGYDAVLYISAGVGLGGAVIRSGLTETGTSGYASEFGHMTMDPDGLPCACGSRGCWETQVSQGALLRYAREYVASHKSSVVSTLAGIEPQDLTVAHIIQAADKNDPAALYALEKTGHYLGIGIASLVNALNPDVVVFGGVLSSAEDYLLIPIREELWPRALRWNVEATNLALAEFRCDACVMGGIATVRQAVISQPERLIAHAAESE